MRIETRNGHLMLVDNEDSEVRQGDLLYVEDKIYFFAWVEHDDMDGLFYVGLLERRDAPAWTGCVPVGHPALRRGASVHDRIETWGCR